MSVKKLPLFINRIMPYAWDDSLSVYEMIAKLVKKINEVVKLFNEEVSDQVAIAVAEELKDFTIEQIRELMLTGRVAEFIVDQMELILGQTIDEAVAVATLDVKRLTDFPAVTNTDGAVTAVLNTALTYFNKEHLFKYGNGHTLFDDGKRVDGKFEIDCSSFVQAALEGITYENSQYLNSKNYKKSFGMDFPSKWFTYSRMLAHDLAEYAYKNGWCFVPNEDYSNLKPGDVIFMRNGVQDYDWGKIGHVRLITNIEQNGRIHFLESNSPFGSLGVVRHQSYTPTQFKVQVNDLVARFPMKDVALPGVNINTGAYKEYSTGALTMIPLKTIKNLESYKMYTAFFKIDFKEASESYPVLRMSTLDKNTVYSFLYPCGKPDGMYRCSFFIPFDIPVGFEKLINVMKAEGSGKYVDVKFAALYEGLITDYIGYAQNIPEEI